MIEGFIYELFNCFMENMAILVVKFSSKAGIQKLTNFDPKLNMLFKGNFDIFWNRGMTSPQKLVNFDIQQLILKSSCLFKSSSIEFSEHLMNIFCSCYHSNSRKIFFDCVYFRQKCLWFCIPPFKTSQLILFILMKNQIGI